MIDRFFVSLIRPSRIGLYMKDKIWMPIVHMLIMLILGATLLAVRSFTMDYFSSSTRYTITKSIQSVKKEMNIKYVDNKLIGGNVILNLDDYFISFNGETKSPTMTKISVYFTEDKVRIEYLFERKTINYSDLNFNESFDLELVRNNNIESSMNFGIFIDKIFNNFNTNYQRAIFIGDVLYSVLFLGVCLILSLVSSYFSNPPIDMPIRIRLCMYDTLIYFIPVYFSFALGINWILYIGLALSYIYTKITFSRIRKVRIRK